MRSTLFIFLIQLFFTIPMIAQKINAEHELKIIEKLSENNIESALHYGDSILQYDFPNKGKIYLKNGYNCLKRQDYSEALVYFEKSKEDFASHNQPKDLAFSLLALGQVSALTDKKNIAIKHVLEANTIAKKNNLRGVEAESNTVLATIFYIYKDYKKSVVYARNAYLIQKVLKDTTAISAATNNLAVYFEKSQMLDSALFYHKKALELKKKSNNQISIAVSYNNIAKTMFKLKSNEEAISYYKKSIKIYEQLNSKIVTPYRNLADVYWKLGNLTLAKSNYAIALELALAQKNEKDLEYLYKTLLKISLQEKDFENSLLYQKKRDSMNLINISKENEEKIRLIDNQYEQAERERELVQKLEINKKNKIIFAVLTGLLLFLGLFFAQRNRNTKLKLNQEKLLLEQKVLRTQMNPHFIFNALTAIQKTIFDDDPLKSSSYLSRFAKLIRQNFEFVDKKHITLEEDLDALKNYIETQQLRFEDKFEYTLEVDDKIDISYTKIPPMLLQPFVENSIEHGIRQKKGKGLLHIGIFKEQHYIRFEIIDNGVGYREKKNSDNREHAIDIFLKRLKLRNLGEEDLFSIQPVENNKGTIVTIKLKI